MRLAGRACVRMYVLVARMRARVLDLRVGTGFGAWALDGTEEATHVSSTLSTTVAREWALAARGRGREGPVCTPPSFAAGPLSPIQAPVYPDVARSIKRLVLI